MTIYKYLKYPVLVFMTPKLMFRMILPENFHPKFKYFVS